MEIPLKNQKYNYWMIWWSNSGCIAEGYEYRISKRYLPSHVHWSIVDSKQNTETTYRSILVALVVQNLPSSAGDIGHTGSTPAMTWRRACQSTPVFLPAETMDRGALQGIAHGITKSWTRLKWQHKCPSVNESIKMLCTYILHKHNGIIQLWDERNP